MGKKEFADALSGESEVSITFARKKDGRMRTIPIWFATEGANLQLLPMYGFKTRWYQDVEKSGRVELAVKDQRIDVSPKILKDGAAVEHIKVNFAKKYGAGDVKRYYPTSDVALEIVL